jgi:hypothetical protein
VRVVQEEEGLEERVARHAPKSGVRRRRKKTTTRTRRRRRRRRRRAREEGLAWQGEMEVEGVAWQGEMEVEVVAVQEWLGVPLRMGGGSRLCIGLRRHVTGLSGLQPVSSRCSCVFVLCICYMYIIACGPIRRDLVFSSLHHYTL